MKILAKFFALIAIFYFLCGNTFGQNTAFIYTEMPTVLEGDDQKMEAFANAVPHIGDMHLVVWNAEIEDENGTINVQLPTSGGNLEILTFDVQDVQFADDGGYTFIAGDESQYFTAVFTETGKGGSIDLVDRRFTLYPFSGNRSLLIENDLSAGEPSICGDLPEDRGNEEENYCTEDCGSAVLDALVLVTPEATQWMQDNWGQFWQFFLWFETNNINIALYRSNIDGKRVRFHYQDWTPDFPLTTNIIDDRGALSSSQGALNLLNNIGCDIGILLTGQAYGGIYGITNSLNPSSTNKWVIAQASHIGPIRYTLAHELAHQFGCLHSIPLGSGCPHGKNMSNGRNTIVANSADNTRVQNFSNPDVSFGGESTGTANQRDNAAQIRGSFCEVSQINNLNPSFHVGIDVFTEICEDEPFGASAEVFAGSQQTLFGTIVNFGLPPYSYSWAWSPNSSFSPSIPIGGNSSSISLSGAPSCPYFYLRLEVESSDGLTAMFTDRYVCDFPCSGSSMRDGKPMGYVKLTSNIHGNPANISFWVESESPIISISLIGLNGIIAKEVIYDDEVPEKKQIAVFDLAEGMYLVKIYTSKGIEVKKVFVEHN